MTPQYDILGSFMHLVKHYNITYVYDGDKPLKITCQYCIGFVRRAGTVDN